MHDSTVMCPKHGVAHGVCVDPVKTNDLQRAELPSSLAKAIKLERTCTATRCSICSDAIDKGIVEIDRNGVVHTWDDPETHTRLGPTEVPDLTNRFDPYEALDEIEHLTHYEVPGEGFLLIQDKIYALRAYITGMEKS